MKLLSVIALIVSFSASASANAALIKTKPNSKKGLQRQLKKDIDNPNLIPLYYVNKRGARLITGFECTLRGEEGNCLKVRGYLRNLKENKIRRYKDSYSYDGAPLLYHRLVTEVENNDWAEYLKVYNNSDGFIDDYKDPFFRALGIVTLGTLFVVHAVYALGSVIFDTVKAPFRISKINRIKRDKKLIIENKTRLLRALENREAFKPVQLKTDFYFEVFRDLVKCSGEVATDEQSNTSYLAEFCY